MGDNMVKSTRSQMIMYCGFWKEMFKYSNTLSFTIIVKDCIIIFLFLNGLQESPFESVRESISKLGRSLYH